MKRRGFVCALDRIRTYDLLLRRQTLYPLSYEGNQGSCRDRRDVLELSRKVGSKRKSAARARRRIQQRIHQGERQPRMMAP